LFVRTLTLFFSMEIKSYRPFLSLLAVVPFFPCALCHWGAPGFSRRSARPPRCGPRPFYPAGVGSCFVDVMSYHPLSNYFKVPLFAFIVWAFLHSPPRWAFTLLRFAPPRPWSSPSVFQCVPLCTGPSPPWLSLLAETEPFTYPGDACRGHGHSSFQPRYY